MEPQNRADQGMERVISRLLRIGVTVSALAVLTGGIFYLGQYGRYLADYTVFRGEPPYLLTFGGILQGIQKAESVAVIQLGLILLIFTPVARVAFSVISYMRQRDFLYAAITVFVLAVLLRNLLG